VLACWSGRTRTRCLEMGVVGLEISRWKDGMEIAEVRPPACTRALTRPALTTSHIFPPFTLNSHPHLILIPSLSRSLGYVSHSCISQPLSSVSTWSNQPLNRDPGPKSPPKVTSIPIHQHHLTDISASGTSLSPCLCIFSLDSSHASFPPVGVYLLYGGCDVQVGLNVLAWLLFVTPGTSLFHLMISFPLFNCQSHFPTLSWSRLIATQPTSTDSVFSSTKKPGLKSRHNSMKSKNKFMRQVTSSPNHG